MARIRRANLPGSLLVQLLTRIRERHISHEQHILLARWLDTQPEVPDGPWFKKFSGLTVCGKGELIKTFLQPGQIATGKELNWVQTPGNGANRRLELEGELADSDFGLLSGFGLPWPVKSSCYFTGRSSDFRAAEHDLPSTGRPFEQPCPADRKEFLVLMAVTLSGSHPQAKAE